MSAPPDFEIRAGFIPLVDCAPLVVAANGGFAAAEGLRLTLVRETSWATVRDRLAVRHLDVAHILAPMALAANLGLGPLPTPLIVPMSLGCGGHTITVSSGLWSDLSAAGAPNDFSAAGAARALAAVIAERRRRGAPMPVFGIVHPYSAHHYDLAYWLAYAGLAPGRDVELVVVPPPLASDALAMGQIDGFCAGEPWGSVAVAAGAGVILTTKANIWRTGPDKVLGVRRDWAERHEDALVRLIRAVWRAAVWCDDPANREALAELLARPEHLAQPAEVLLPSLSKRLIDPTGRPREVGGFLVFAEQAASFPWISHALWFYAQMVRCGQVAFSPAGAETAANTYRPDLYRSALTALGATMPAANAKVEGALASDSPAGASQGRLVLSADGFFDGRVFDPDDLAGYVGDTRVVPRHEPPA